MKALATIRPHGGQCDYAKVNDSRTPEQQSIEETSPSGDPGVSYHLDQNAEQEKAAALVSMAEIVVCQDAEMRVLWANSVAAQSVGLSLA